MRVACFRGPAGAGWPPDAGGAAKAWHTAREAIWEGLLRRVRGVLHNDGGRRRGITGPLVGAVDGVVPLLPMDGHLLGGDDPEPDFIAANLDHRHSDVVVDHDTFVFFPGQYKHCSLSF